MRRATLVPGGRRVHRLVKQPIAPALLEEAYA
jgi:hypothetical protein